MKTSKVTSLREIMTAVVTVGAVWGIFEATVGYGLHLLPVSIGFLVWYPVAAFFLVTAYRITGKRSAVLATAVLAASIKLLNLMLPGRIDRVINPAVSILLEGIAVFTAIYVFERIKMAPRPFGMLLISIGTNTMWRFLYLGYLVFLVPDWIREASVLKSADNLIRFLVIDNFCSSLIVFAGMLVALWLSKRGLEPPRVYRQLKRSGSVWMAVALLTLNITLQMVL